MTLLLIATTGALGALARYGVGIAAQRFLGESFPFSTLLVNVVGCLIIGVAHSACLARPSAEQWIRHGLMIGFLGVLTTFSTFSLDSVRLMQDGKTQLALVNVLTSVVVCLIATWVGLRVGEKIWM